MEKKSQSHLSRRTFMQGAAVIGAAPLMAKRALPVEGNMSSQTVKGLYQKTLGQTGVQVSAMGLGGYHLGSANTDQVANEIVAKALDHGINFFDNAWEYHDGVSEESLGRRSKANANRHS